MAKQNPATAAGVHLTRDSTDDALLVEAYGAGGFKLQDRRVKGSLYVNGQGFWPVDAADVSALGDIDIATLMADHKPELVLVGTGAAMQLLPKALRQQFEALGISCDPMDTGAAARTYNVLHLEGRHVAALLLAVP